ncbi:MAG: uracil-DNA glycosylase family protein [Sphingopyxis sp.]
MNAPVNFAQPGQSAPATAAPTRPLAMPADFAGFDQWLRDGADVPGGQWSPVRVLPTGPANPGLMILSDVPDPSDMDAARLFSGPSGRLLDAMLGAIGLTRDDVRTGSIAVTRPIGGRLEGVELPALLEMARHHIRLVQPAALLILGQQSCKILAGSNIPAQAEPLRDVNHIDAKTVAFAMHHPRMLIERPLLKRPAWAVLKCLKELRRA